MKDNPVPIYIIEFMSDEWKTWALFSMVFISIPLILGKFLNRERKIQVDESKKRGNFSANSRDFRQKKTHEYLLKYYQNKHLQAP